MPKDEAVLRMKIKSPKPRNIFSLGKWTVVILLLLYILATLKDIESRLQVVSNTTFKLFGSLHYPIVIGNLQSQLIDLERKLDKQQELLEYIDESTRGY